MSLVSITTTLLISEIGFYMYYRYKLRLAHRRHIPPSLSQEEKELLLDRFITTTRKHGQGPVVSAWFMQEHTKRPLPCGTFNGCLKELFAWAFYHARPDEMVEEDRQWLDYADDKFRKEINLIENPELGKGKLCAHTIDPVVARHRPLVIYLIAIAAKVVGAGILIFLGFKNLQFQGLSVWHRKALKNEEWRQPVIFFHGIGPGPVAYVHMLKEIRGECLVVELPWVSMSLFSEPPLDSIGFGLKVVKLLAHFKLLDVCLVGHSYGSVVVAWILRAMKDYNKVVFNYRLVLMDPVSLYLLVPKVCYSFLYEQPKGFFQRVTRHWASEELGVAIALRRRFFWTQCVLFAEELPSDSTVFLSENDHIVPVDIVYEECKKYVKTVKFPGTSHGGILGSLAHTSVIANAINSNSK
jgi:pimeloyl-ACP methyl ester carboxylesterase